mmetsp:Transcript_25133/g.42037  ORF Transcript_25133/g.42037 Transcript_25133/m.42037 type:complete len:254 (-) Transcript_25133:175-936(-)|eukprot:CAMPEP_0198211560 /NCGR_PEP_ID=MMETSP1445-20131203/24472_1 /TAXON_ID=36898 /ORGANISM="Pyramimonas sp., Strain CCMP2087" /LENGTH=253 /DNA_ID=CAMNT_0043885835 /DNA_START=66 /DNA_END=827 /DNA_ORIENTATION=+
MNTAVRASSSVIIRSTATYSRAVTKAAAYPNAAAHSAKKAVFFRNAVSSKHYVINSTLLRNRLICNASDAAAPAEPAAEAEPAEELMADRLDIRVGKVLKAWKHPEAEKLFIEEVDVGEEEPRQILSGLIGYVSEEEMQGRAVVVLCNLKARNLAGVKSDGMLLCASDAAHETVQLLTPPADAPVGERIKFGSWDAVQTPPDAPNRVQKKKVFEAVQPDFNTTDEMVCRYKDLDMCTSTGVVTVASLKGASIS